MEVCQADRIELRKKWTTNIREVTWVAMLIGGGYCKFCWCVSLNQSEAFIIRKEFELCCQWPTYTSAKLILA